MNTILLGKQASQFSASFSARLPEQLFTDTHQGAASQRSLAGRATETIATSVGEQQRSPGSLLKAGGSGHSDLVTPPDTPAAIVLCLCFTCHRALDLCSRAATLEAECVRAGSWVQASGSPALVQKVLQGQEQLPSCLLSLTQMRGAHPHGVGLCWERARLMKQKSARYFAPLKHTQSFNPSFGCAKHYSRANCTEFSKPVPFLYISLPSSHWISLFPLLCPFFSLGLRNCSDFRLRSLIPSLVAKLPVSDCPAVVTAHRPCFYFVCSVLTLGKAGCSVPVCAVFNC